MVDDNNREWCIMHPDYPDSPHRGPWPEAQCRRWIEETKELAPQFAGLRGFYVAARKVGPWERDDQ